MRDTVRLPISTSLFSILCLSFLPFHRISLYSFPHLLAVDGTILVMVPLLPLLSRFLTIAAWSSDHGDASSHTVSLCCRFPSYTQARLALVNSLLTPAYSFHRSLSLLSTLSPRNNFPFSPHNLHLLSTLSLFFLHSSLSFSRLSNFV